MIKIDRLEPYEDHLGNRIIGNGSGTCIIEIRGKNCTLILGEGCSINGIIWLDCDNATVEIGAEGHYRGEIRAGLEANIVFGAYSTVTDEAFMSAAEGTSIVVGQDCMFAKRNQIRADDAHPIFCRLTGKRLNPSSNILIGDHVWLGYEALVSKGVTIGSGSIVGQRSIVTSDLASNCLAVGSPARVIRENVEWERKHLTLTPPHNFPTRSLSQKND